MHALSNGASKQTTAGLPIPFLLSKQRKNYKNPDISTNIATDITTALRTDIRHDITTNISNDIIIDITTDITMSNLCVKTVNKTRPWNLPWHPVTGFPLLVLQLTHHLPPLSHYFTILVEIDFSDF